MFRTKEVKIYLTEEEYAYIKKHNEARYTVGQSVEIVVRRALASFKEAQVKSAEPEKPKGIMKKIGKLFGRNK